MSAKIPFERSFASSPKAKFWSSKNGDIKPENVRIRSSKQFWFKCENCVHNIYISPDKIAGGNWCQYCCVPAQKLCDDEECKQCFDKSFASNEKAQYWGDLNELKPNQVLKNSNKKYWFNCPCGHNFNSVLGSINKGSFCPYCCVPPKKLCDKEDCQLCFTNSFASHEKAKFWNIEKNGTNTPRKIFKYSNEKCYFDCNKCKHTFDVSLCNIRLGRWCPTCSNQKLCTEDNCEWCFNNSFASHEKSKMWSTKNNEITPRMVAKCSGKKYWFKCDDCKHDFEANINHIVSKSVEKNCPLCSSQWLCNDEQCQICTNKSFISSPRYKNLIKEKHSDVNFRMIFKNSNSKYWFKCECEHSFEMTLASISSGSWCSYCCIPTQKLCDNEECKHCFEKSFASHYRAKYFNEKDIKPRNILKGSDFKYNFICDNGHSFLKQISLITANGHSFCPMCINKTEKILHDKLITIYPELVFQYRVDWCRNDETNNYLPFDYVLKDKKIIIELDGKQHFVQVNNWAKPEETQKRDIYKMKKANENGYSVIRILQIDVYRDKYDWCKEIIENIEKIVAENKVQNIFMCKKNEYDCYKLQE